MNVELISVGRELLIGKVLNTNAQWMADKITRLGAKVTRITAVDDDVNAIAGAVIEAVSREPTFIILTGGLGPTFDDKTLDSIGHAFSLPMGINDNALGTLKTKYQQLVKNGIAKTDELTPARLKMATFPQSATPLKNSVGTAPGVFLEREGVKIICLPGVPREMEEIFNSSVLPMFTKTLEGCTYYESTLTVLGITESELSPIIDEIMRSNPGVYLKSHPRGAENVPRLDLHFSSISFDGSTVETAADQMRSQVVRLGGTISNS